MRVKDFSNGRLGRICQHALDVPHRHVDRAKHRNDLSGLALGDGVIAIARLWVNESRLQEPCLVIVAEVAYWDSGAAGGTSRPLPNRLGCLGPSPSSAHLTQL